MNINEVISAMDGGISKVSESLSTHLQSSEGANDPESALQMQYLMQQYSVMIGYKSSVMAAFRDMMKGIISKIG
jgi:type III secretion protein F